MSDFNNNCDLSLVWLGEHEASVTVYSYVVVLTTMYYPPPTHIKLLRLFRRRKRHSDSWRSGELLGPLSTAFDRSALLRVIRNVLDARVDAMRVVHMYIALAVPEDDIPRDALSRLTQLPIAHLDVQLARIDAGHVYYARLSQVAQHCDLPKVEASQLVAEVRVDVTSELFNSTARRVNARAEALDQGRAASRDEAADAQFVLRQSMIEFLASKVRTEAAKAWIRAFDEARTKTAEFRTDAAKARTQEGGGKSGGKFTSAQILGTCRT